MFQNSEIYYQLNSLNKWIYPQAAIQFLEVPLIKNEA